MTFYYKYNRLAAMGILIGSALFLGMNSFSKTTLACDFSNPGNVQKTMRYHWNTFNAISPSPTFEMIPGPHSQVNIVRPLGGRIDRRTNKKLISEDTYKWDGTNYVYDWVPLKKQLDRVLEQTEIHQLVLDNPSWAFQRGLNLTEKQSVDTYGNPWAPNDAEAWATYIKAMLNELIQTYGREKVGSWRYCVGREIGTPGHWQSGEQAFFDHYKNTEQAVREVLPEAQVGTHLLWASSKHSYGQNFIPWCKENGARYDFLGISYYPKYRSKDRVDMDHFYAVDIAPLVESPDWNTQATFEFHEFALIEDMVNHKAIRAPELHRNVFPLMMAKMVYEKDLHDVFVWSDAPVYTEIMKLLKGMEGHTYYESTKQGEPQHPGNMIDAIFSRDGNVYEITAYNYTADSEAENNEPLLLAAAIPVPAKTPFKYRVGVYTKEVKTPLWSDWKNGKTSPMNDQKKSAVTFQTEMPTLSYLKYEISTNP
jgi:hypothetical protein